MHTLLVADDEPAIRRIIVRRILSFSPTCTIVEAFDGPSALAVLATTELTGIITDHMMPGATGLDVLTAAREHRPLLPVLVVSAHTSLAETALRQGATGFLSKPFTLAQLDSALQLVIRP